MDVWYYPRKDLAARFLKILEIGISSNLAIVAPRRKGKTLFMLNDLASLARKKGYIPVYASLWQDINAPQEGLISALQETLDTLDKKLTINKVLKSKIDRVSIGNELIGKVDIEFANNPKQPTKTDLALIDDLLSKVQQNSKKKTILLLIDEIQHLATSPRFDALTFALRTMLDKRLGKIKVIFTGSSRHYMNLLFNKFQSPFYNFVEMVPFPDFGDDFLTFILEKMDNKNISLQDLRKAFVDIDKSPYWMMKIISYNIINKASLNQSLHHILQLIDAAEGFDDICKKLKPIDKMVFLTLSSNENPFSKKLLSNVEKLTSVKGIPSNVQRSIKRLTVYNLVSQVEKGKYQIEKPGFRRYLLAKEKVNDMLVL